MDAITRDETRLCGALLRASKKTMSPRTATQTVPTTDRRNRAPLAIWRIARDNPVRGAPEALAGQHLDELAARHERHAVVLGEDFRRFSERRVGDDDGPTRLVMGLRPDDLVDGLDADVGVPPLRLDDGARPAAFEHEVCSEVPGGSGRRDAVPEMAEEERESLLELLPAHLVDFVDCGDTLNITAGSPWDADETGCDENKEYDGRFAQDVTMGAHPGNARDAELDQCNEQKHEERIRTHHRPDH